MTEFRLHIQKSTGETESCKINIPPEPPWYLEFTSNSVGNRKIVSKTQIKKERYYEID